MPLGGGNIASLNLRVVGPTSDALNMFNTIYGTADLIKAGGAQAALGWVFWVKNLFDLENALVYKTIHGKDFGASYSIIQDNKSLWTSPLRYLFDVRWADGNPRPVQSTEFLEKIFNENYRHKVDLYKPWDNISGDKNTPEAKKFFESRKFKGARGFWMVKLTPVEVVLDAWNQTVGRIPLVGRLLGNAKHVPIWDVHNGYEFGDTEILFMLEALNGIETIQMNKFADIGPRGNEIRDELIKAGSLLQVSYSEVILNHDLNKVKENLRKIVKDTVEVSQLSGFGFIKGTKYDTTSTNKESIWEKVSKKEVRLKQDVILSDEDVIKIFKNDYGTFMNIMQQPLLFNKTIAFLKTAKVNPLTSYTIERGRTGEYVDLKTGIISTNQTEGSLKAEELLIGFKNVGVESMLTGQKQGRYAMFVSKRFLPSNEKFMHNHKLWMPEGYHLTMPSLIRMAKSQQGLKALERNNQIVWDWLRGGVMERSGEKYIKAGTMQAQLMKEGVGGAKYSETLFSVPVDTREESALKDDKGQVITNGFGQPLYGMVITSPRAVLRNMQSTLANGNQHTLLLFKEETVNTNAFKDQPIVIYRFNGTSVLDHKPAQTEALWQTRKPYDFGTNQLKFPWGAIVSRVSTNAFPATGLVETNGMVTITNNFPDHFKYVPIGTNTVAGKYPQEFGIYISPADKLNYAFIFGHESITAITDKNMAYKETSPTLDLPEGAKLIDGTLVRDPSTGKILKDDVKTIVDIEGLPPVAVQPSKKAFIRETFEQELVNGAQIYDWLTTVKGYMDNEGHFKVSLDEIRKGLDIDFKDSAEQISKFLRDPEYHLIVTTRSMPNLLEVMKQEGYKAAQITPQGKVMFYKEGEIPPSQHRHTADAPAPVASDALTKSLSAGRDLSDLLKVIHNPKLHLSPEQWKKIETSITGIKAQEKQIKDVKRNIAKLRKLLDEANAKLNIAETTAFENAWSQEAGIICNLLNTAEQIRIKLEDGMLPVEQLIIEMAAAQNRSVQSYKSYLQSLSPKDQQATLTRDAVNYFTTGSALYSPQNTNGLVLLINQTLTNLNNLNAFTNTVPATNYLWQTNGPAYNYAWTTNISYALTNMLPYWENKLSDPTFTNLYTYTNMAQVNQDLFSAQTNYANVQIQINNIESRTNVESGNLLQVDLKNLALTEADLNLYGAQISFIQSQSAALQIKTQSGLTAAMQLAPDVITQAINYVNAYINYGKMFTNDYSFFSSISVPDYTGFWSTNVNQISVAGGQTNILNGTAGITLPNSQNLLATASATMAKLNQDIAQAQNNPAVLANLLTLRSTYQDVINLTSNYNNNLISQSQYVAGLRQDAINQQQAAAGLSQNKYSNVTGWESSSLSYILNNTVVSTNQSGIPLATPATLQGAGAYQAQLTNDISSISTNLTKGIYGTAGIQQLTTITNSLNQLALASQQYVTLNNEFNAHPPQITLQQYIDGLKQIDANTLQAYTNWLNAEVAINNLKAQGQLFTPQVQALLEVATARQLNLEEKDIQNVYNRAGFNRDPFLMMGDYLDNLGQNTESKIVAAQTIKDLRKKYKENERKMDGLAKDIVARTKSAEAAIDEIKAILMPAAANDRRLSEALEQFFAIYQLPMADSIIKAGKKLYLPNGSYIILPDELNGGVFGAVHKSIIPGSTSYNPSGTPVSRIVWRGRQRTIFFKRQDG